MSQIGFIGLGHMGHPMAMNLLKAGFAVDVYDLNAKAVASIVKEGATAKNTIADTVREADIVFTILQTGEQVLSVCVGDEGLFNHIPTGALYIDSSSIDIQTCKKIHAEAEKIGLAMIDAPVSGGVKGAENAALTIMVGGSEIDFNRAKPVLEKLSKLVVHAGASGSGQAAKICNNMILGISMIGVCEAFSLADKLELDPQKLFEIASHASGQCWSITSYCPWPNVMDNVPSNNAYAPGFTSTMMLKDLKLSQDAAHYAKANTPMGERAMQLYQQFVDSDGAEKDFSGIIQMLSREPRT